MKKVIIDIADNHGDAVTITCVGHDEELNVNVSGSAIRLDKEITRFIVDEYGRFKEV